MKEQPLNCIFKYYVHITPDDNTICVWFYLNTVGDVFRGLPVKVMLHPSSWLLCLDFNPMDETNIVIKILHLQCKLMQLSQPAWLRIFSTPIKMLTHLFERYCLVWSNYLELGYSQILFAACYDEYRHRLVILVFNMWLVDKFCLHYWNMFVTTMIISFLLVLIYHFLCDDNSGTLMLIFTINDW